jgi:hypothetical protein
MYAVRCDGGGRCTDGQDVVVGVGVAWVVASVPGGGWGRLPPVGRYVLASGSDVGASAKGVGAAVRPAVDWS